MLYKSEELKNLYKSYLQNRTHSWKPYTQYWFSILLLKASSLEDIYSRERLPINKRKKVEVRKRQYEGYKKYREEGYSHRECEEVFWISKYLYNKIENEWESERITWRV